MTTTNSESIQHRRSKKKRASKRSSKRSSRRCSRRKCALRIPLVGICLWRTTVRTKCRLKRRK